MLKPAQYLFGQCPLALQHSLWYIFVPALLPNLGLQVFFSPVTRENPESGPALAQFQQGKGREPLWVFPTLSSPERP